MVCCSLHVVCCSLYVVWYDWFVLVCVCACLMKCLFVCVFWVYDLCWFVLFDVRRLSCGISSSLCSVDDCCSLVHGGVCDVVCS